MRSSFSFAFILSTVLTSGVLSSCSLLSKERELLGVPYEQREDGRRYLKDAPLSYVDPEGFKTWAFGWRMHKLSSTKKDRHWSEAKRLGGSFSGPHTWKLPEIRIEAEDWDVVPDLSTPRERGGIQGGIRYTLKESLERADATAVARSDPMTGQVRFNTKGESPWYSFEADYEPRPQPQIRGLVVLLCHKNVVYRLSMVATPEQFEESRKAFYDFMKSIRLHEGDKVISPDWSIEKHDPTEEWLNS